MKNFEKYERSCFMPPQTNYDWLKKDHIEKAPMWCSVDLRDGNQALIEPMSLEEKLKYFQMLVEIGFQEIAVGFPAASETEYGFVRMLIEQKIIPDTVTIQVLTQPDEHMIRKTFEAVSGAKRAELHLYHSTSQIQRQQIQGSNRQEVKELVVSGAKLFKVFADETEGDFTFEYSPEDFTETEMDFSLEVCNAVLDVWQPTRQKKCIINLPATVERAMPHVFAGQVEYMSRHLKYRDAVILSVHPHNDRGCAVSAAEFALLAGAERLEGTLFGNGERTGNADIVTIAMNLFSQGVNPMLDFSEMPKICEIYENVTKMKVPLRHPYAGELVFTAFSGSHQNAIAKGMDYRREHPDEKWRVPYLSIDPHDVGRTYDKDIIRINSQSGKGGVSYLLKEKYSMTLPEGMQEEVACLIKDVSDKTHKELTAEEIYSIFEDKYIHNNEVFQIVDISFQQMDEIVVEASLCYQGRITKITATGNGRVDAFSNLLKQFFGIQYELAVYEQHSLSKGSHSKVAAYIGIVCNGRTFWGVGIHADMVRASIHALAAAVNQLEEIRDKTMDERMMDILNFIQEHYTCVNLDDLSNRFHLSKPYLSKYIKEKSGQTFGDIVRGIRMKKAKVLLQNTSMTVENVSRTLGYDNVEHFSRSFKKVMNMTPMQYRNSKE